MQSIANYFDEPYHLNVDVHTILVQNWNDIALDFWCRRTSTKKKKKKTKAEKFLRVDEEYKICG